MAAEGIDPINHRDTRRLAHETTWGQCANSLIDSLRPSWRNLAQADQWEQSLREYGPDRSLPVRIVTTTVALNALRAIWTTKTETATRVRGRCERIWDYARVSGLVAGDNPFRWRGHLDKLLPPPAKVARAEHFSAMPYSSAPAFVKRLREHQSLSRLALEFTILTAARTNEVVGAPWSEFDLDAGLWAIPATRTKVSREHIVPLTARAIDLLAGLH